MSSSFTQLYLHIIFAVGGKKSMLNSANEQEIYHFISQVAEKQGHEILIINGTTDHIHLLVKLNPVEAISDLVREIKKQSSWFINHKLPAGKKFNWEKGFRAYSHTRSQATALYKFIEKQKEYHHNVKFKEEYLHLNDTNDEETDDTSIFKYKYP
jgi:putative transposase